MRLCLHRAVYISVLKKENLKRVVVLGFWDIEVRESLLYSSYKPGVSNSNYPGADERPVWSVWGPDFFLSIDLPITIL